MIADPPVRPDGLCVCGGGAADLDAFCSSTCARAYHGCSLPFVRGPGTRAKAEVAA